MERIIFIILITIVLISGTVLGLGITNRQGLYAAPAQDFQLEEPEIKEIRILNVQSHPRTGDKWSVYFETKGRADLIINPLDRATIKDLDFISLKCGEEERRPQILEGDVIFYPDWSCDKATSSIIHLVNIAGRHTLKFQFGNQTAFAYNSPDTVTYYFDDFDAGEYWSGDPAYMVDGNLDSFAYTNVPDEVELLTSNTCPGTDLGTITKVEIRAYGNMEGAEPGNDNVYLRPVYTGGDGQNNLFELPATPDWSPYFDITNDTNAPSPWTWSDIQNLDCDVQAIKTQDPIVRIAKVEIRVTYGYYIPVEYQQWSTSSGINYGSGTAATSSTNYAVELDLSKPTSHPSTSTDDIYWGIGIPSDQTFGTYSGTTTFEAKAD